MNRELVIDCSPELIRTAIIEDGKLCEIHQAHNQKKKLTESLFLGCIQAIKPALSAAFVDIGEELNAFLPLGKHQAYRCGDEIIVQGSAVQAVETKGLRITDTINLAGKWLVLIPGSEGIRFSKKIKDAELRDALLHVMEPLIPDGFGVIVRTASSDVTDELLKAELEDLVKLWDSIRLKANGMRKPGIVHEPLDLPMQILRDMGGSFSAVVTNSTDMLSRITQAKQCGWLAEETEIRLYEEKNTLLNDVYSIDAQVDKALKKRVWLPCGGYLVFDECEALTVVDVNSGKMTLGRNLDGMALRVNLEAAQEIARQLRLRDIGGIIVVDYIDMRREEDRKQLLCEIQKVSSLDQTQITLGGLTKFGLVEMIRKRKRERLSKVMQVNCKTCSGSGTLLSGEEIAHRALRQIRRMLISGQRGPFLVRCASSVFSALSGMTAPYSIVVYAVPENSRHTERIDIDQLDINVALPKGSVQLKKG